MSKSSPFHLCSGKVWGWYTNHTPVSLGGAYLTYNNTIPKHITPYQYYTYDMYIL